MIGERIGRYRVDAEIGRGGMGIVYRATQLTLDRTVAIKMLPHHMAGSEEYLARFRREAETLARLAHEDIVHIYDIEEHAGDHFIVMEYVSGPSLTRMLADRGRLDPAQARDVAVIVAGALAVAHRKGIVHRDLKPDNILFSAAGRPRLTDFGIAHMRDDREYKTRTGIMLGTPYYLSPEQARGQPVTPASDLYSLGVVLYEMLSGAVPFDGADPLAVALKHIQEPPPALRRRAPNVPKELARVVERALEKDPAKRFRDAAAMRARLIELDLGIPPGLALGMKAEAAAGEATCPECGTALAADFLRCPGCGAAVRRTCTRCGHRYDPLAPACPVCRTPAPGARAADTPRGVEARLGEAAGRVAGAARDGIDLASEGAAVAAARAREGLGRAAAAAREHAPSATGIRRVVQASRHRAATMPPVAWLGAALVAAGLALTLLLATRSDHPAVEPPASDLSRADLPLGPGPAGPSAETSALSALTPPGETRTSGPVLTDEPAAPPTAAAGVALDWASREVRAVAGSTKPDTVRIQVVSSGRWKVSKDARWVTAVPSSGTGDGTILLVIDPSGLGPGSHAAVVTVTGDDGTSARTTVVLVLTPAPAAPGLSDADRKRAESAIGDLIDVYREATEAGAFDRLTPLVSDAVARKWRDGFAALHEEARDVSLRMTGTRVEVQDATHARVTFHATIRGVERRRGVRRTYFDGAVRWDLTRLNGRWTITSSSR